MRDVLEIQIGRTKLEILGPPETYIFSGHMDEKFLARFVPLPKTTSVQIDLSELKNINSMGVREWINLMREWSQLSDITLRNCSITIMDQLNIVPQMIGKAKLISFQAPYFCPQCEKEVIAQIDCNANKPSLLLKKAPAIKHDCGTYMEFDALEESYFRLIDRFLPN